MKIGVDSSILIAAVHANHPLHKPSSRWLDQAFGDYEVTVAHHSILESYAVLTRLPGSYRLTPVEAQTVLVGTLRKNATVASFSDDMVWDIIDTMVQLPVSGGSSYDVFIIEILNKAGVECIATHNTSDFTRLTTTIKIIDPLESD